MTYIEEEDSELNFYNIIRLTLCFFLHSIDESVAEDDKEDDLKWNIKGKEKTNPLSDEPKKILITTNNIIAQHSHAS